MGWAGGLDRSEVQQLLKGMGRPAEESDMDAAMADLDKDGNGTVEFTEFLDWWQGGKLSKDDKRLIAGALGVSEPEPEPEPQPRCGLGCPRPGQGGCGDGGWRWCTREGAPAPRSHAAHFARLCVL